MQFLLLVCALLLTATMLTGLVRPSWVIRWRQRPTQMEVVVVYGTSAVVFMAAAGVAAMLSPEEPAQERKKRRQVVVQEAVADPPPVPLLPHEIVDEEVYDAPIKTQVTQHILLKGKATEAGMRRLLLSRYQALLGRAGFRFRKHPSAVYVYLYTNRERAEAKGGTWVAMLDKPHSAREPTLNVDMDRYAQMTAPAEERFGLPEGKRRLVWNAVTSAEDRARVEAEQRHPMPDPMSRSYTQKAASRALKRQADVEDKLLKKYKAAVRKRFGVTEKQVSAIVVEGIKKKWPMLR